MAKETTDKTFENDVIGSGKPVLVDFWAEWCGPCRQLSPIIDELSKDKSDKIEVYKLNIDKNPEVPTKHGIRGIPTLILFKDGQAIATKVGSLPKSALYEWIDSVVA